MVALALLMTTGKSRERGDVRCLTGVGQLPGSEARAGQDVCQVQGALIGSTLDMHAEPVLDERMPLAVGDEAREQRRCFLSALMTPRDAAPELRACRSGPGACLRARRVRVLLPQVVQSRPGGFLGAGAGDFLLDSSLVGREQHEF